MLPPERRWLMSPDSSDDRFEDRARETPADAATPGAGARPASRRRPSATRSTAHRRGKAGAKDEEPAHDEAGERRREHAADVLAAAREHIVEHPLQAMLVAAAAGAFVALLLGAGRR